MSVQLLKITCSNKDSLQCVHSGLPLPEKESRQIMAMASPVKRMINIVRLLICPDYPNHIDGLAYQPHLSLFQI